jgi:hypothetical protein
MKRRGFLFGLVAAPLVPLVPAKAVAASAEPAVAVSRVLEWRGGARLTIQELIARARMRDVSAWGNEWRCLAEALAGSPLRFSDQTPVGNPFPLPIEDSGWRSWVDSRNVEILRVNRELSASRETKSADTSESGRASASDACPAGACR